MEIDPRGPRFGALITMVVFAAVLITGNVWVLAAQAVVFAAGALLGLRNSPYGLLYKWLVRPRLGPPRELESEAPPRFAQAVGLGIAVIGIIGYGTGATPLGMAAAAAGCSGFAWDASCTCSSAGPGRRGRARARADARCHGADINSRDIYGREQHR
jgi:hypothetical protein